MTTFSEKIAASLPSLSPTDVDYYGGNKLGVDLDSKAVKLLRLYDKDWIYRGFAKTTTTPIDVLNNVYIPELSGSYINFIDENSEPITVPTDYMSYVLVCTDAINGYYELIKLPTIENVLLTKNETSDNVAANYTAEYDDFTISDNANGSVKMLLTTSRTSDYTTNNRMTMKKTWKANHTYLFIMDIDVIADTDTADGGLFPRVIPYSTTGEGTTDEIQKVVAGERGYYITKLTTNAILNNSDADQIRIRMGTYDNTDSCEVDIYGALVIDLGEVGSETLDQNEIINFVNEFGIIEDYKAPIYTKVAKKAYSLEEKTPIVCIGDSLTYQGYPAILSDLTNRITYNYSEGGATSSRIRDIYFANVTDENRQYTHVIYVGRNNAIQFRQVINDIRTIVNDLGHNRFLVLEVPNGGAIAELDGGASYSRYIDLNTYLSEEYPCNFIDTRKSSINGWHCHDVFLDASFTQPSVGGNVQVQVASDRADATDSATDLFLTQNTADVSAFPSEANLFCIGEMLTGQCDVYSLVSQDSDTLVTLQLVEANVVAVGNTVENGTSVDGAVQKKRCFQNLDLFCLENKTTLSTFRKDLIHPTEKGRLFFANEVYKALITKAI